MSADKLRTQVFLVEFIDKENKSQSYVKMVRAIDRLAARHMAETNRTHRHLIGHIVLSRNNTSRTDEQIATRLRKICKGYLNIGQKD